MRLQVLPYTPTWRADFLSLKSKLSSILSSSSSPSSPPPKYISIEHVGSTSVPGLPAKPIIDIDIVIADLSDLEGVKTALTSSVGDYVFMGEWGVPGRYAFRRPKPSKAEQVVQGGGEGTGGGGSATNSYEEVEEPKHNLNVCVEGCQALRNHLAVRDLCLRDEEVRQRYGEVKMELAGREWKDMDEYCEAKNDVLAWILEKAGFERAEVEEIMNVNMRPEEKEKVKSG